MTAWIPGIVDPARTLDDRLAWPAAPPAAPPASLERWVHAVAAGDRAAFERRLGWDGWDAGLAAGALAGMGERGPRPDWVGWLERASERAADILAELAASGRIAEAGLYPQAKPLPFLELWAPFLRAAREGLGEEVWRTFAVEAKGDLERRLLSDLAMRGSLAAYQGFEDQRARRGLGAYRSFTESCLAQGMGGFLRERPALARRLADATQLWVETTAELARRLAADQAELEQSFGPGLGPVTGVEALSESHDGGRRVLSLVFASGRRVVYKPRPVGMEAAFQHLLRRLGEEGLGSAPPSFPMVVREGYGWCGWVESGVVPDAAAAERYFERAGTLLCLVELLGGDDLHAENVVATTGGPVLIDAETLLQPLASAPRPGEEPRLRSQLATSPQTDAAGRPFDLGGLQGQEERLAEAEGRFWRSPNTDAMTVERGPVVVRPGANVLRMRGRACRPAAYTGALARGFEAAYRFLLARRGELLDQGGLLGSFQGLRARVLLRNSQDYGLLVGRLREARFQQSGLAGSLLVEAANRAFTADRRRPAGWEATTSERLSVERGDIPRFEVPVEGVGVVLPDGRAAAGCFAVSGWDALRERLGRMSEGDLAAWLRQVRRLGRRPARRARAPEEEPSAEALALSLGLRLFPSGAPWRLSGRGLYGGRLGTALFAAALARQNGDAVLGMRAASALLAELAHPLPPDLGAFAGVGGEIYAAALLSSWLSDARLASAASARLRRLGLRRLEDAPADLASGLAGFLLGALALGEVAEDAAARELAAEAGRRLAARLASPALSPPGVAHGYAGVALALARLSRATGDRSWLAAAHHAWELESLARTAQPGFGPGLTRHGHGWCRGVAGAGLVALEMSLADPGAGLPVELTVALSCVGAEPRAELDGPCCGAPGEIELLLEASHTLALPGLAERSLRLRSAWLGRLRAAGPALDFDRLGRRRPRPGLFRGLAGVGYALLRSSRPDHWPSVVLFQAPRPAGRGQEVMR